MADQPTEQPEAFTPETPIAQATLTFLADGSIRLQATAIKPTQAWAGGRFLERLGDDLWSSRQAAMAQEAAEAEARKPHLTIPRPTLVRQ